MSEEKGTITKINTVNKLANYLNISCIENRTSENQIIIIIITYNSTKLICNN